MADINKTIKALIEWIEEPNAMNAEIDGSLVSDALELLESQQAEIDRLKKQRNLVNVDKLREKLGFAENCDKCKNDPWRCQRDDYFTEKDFCERLDTAIEELMQEGR